MNYFKKLSEKRMIRKIRKLRKEGGEPIVEKLHQSVLYEKDAYNALRYYANLLAEVPVLPDIYDPESRVLQLACGVNKDENDYWLYIKDGLYYAVQIGLKSRIFIGRTICVPYKTLDFAYLRIPLKDCSHQLWAPSELYGYFVYANNLRPIALMLKGKDVRLEDFESSVWEAKVSYEPKKYQLEGYDCNGCKGEWYDVWYSPYKFRPIYDQKEAEDLLINDHERMWKGEKIIRQFDEKERPSLEDMLIIWKMFCKNA